MPDAPVLIETAESPAPPQEPTAETVDEVLETAEPRGGIRQRVSGRIDRLRRRTAPEEPRQTSTERLHYHESDVGKKVKLTHNQEKQICDKLEKFAQNARVIREKRGSRAEEVSHLTNILYEKEDWIKEVKRKVHSGESLESALGGEVELKEFLGLAYYEVIDEILEKSFQAGKIIKANPQRLQTLLQHHFLGNLINCLTNASEHTLEDAVARISTHYAREIRFDKMSDEQILAHFRQLENLYHGLQASFFGPNAPETTIWQQLTATPAALTDYPRDRPMNFLWHRLSGENGILTLEHNGITLVELERQDPDKFARVLLEAKDRAFTDWCSDLCKKTLEERFERELGPNAMPIKQAQERLNKLTNPAEADRTVTQKEIDEKQTKYDEQKGVVDELKKQLATKEQELVGALEKKETIDDTVGAPPNWGPSITFLDGQITEQQDKIDQVSPRIAALNRNIRDKNLEIDQAPNQQEKDRLMGERNALEKIVERQERARDAYSIQKTKYEEDRKKLLDDQAAADKKVRRIRREIKAMKKKIEGVEERRNAAGDITREAVPGEEAVLENLKAELKALQETHRIESDRIEHHKPTPENERLAKAMGTNLEIMKNCSNVIIDRALFDTEFSPRMLANNSTDPVSHRIRGAETLRELIYNATINPDYLYDPELARELLTDLTIARAVISYLTIDPQRQVTIAAGNVRTIEQIMESMQGENGIALRLAEARLNNQPRLTAQREQELANLVNPLLKEVLPDMAKLSKFEIGDFVQILLKDRLEQTGKGDPFAETWFEARRSPYRVLAESVTQRGCGKARFHKSNDIHYEHRLERRDPNGNRIGDWNARIRITRAVDGRLLVYQDVMLNQSLLSSLPDTRQGAENQGIPAPIIERYYERGRLGRFLGAPPEDELEIRRARDLGWIQAQGPEYFDNLDQVLAGVGPQEGLQRYRRIGQLLPVALGNLLIYEKDLSRNFALLHGFRRTDPIGVVRAETAIRDPADQERVNLRAEMDNTGKIWLIIPGQEPELASAYIERETDRYIATNNLRELDPTHQEQLQGIFQPIQEAIGREVTRTFQRRYVTAPAMRTRTEPPRMEGGRVVY